MILYNLLRTFVILYIVRPIENFLSIHCPAVFEFIFYRLYHKAEYEDCGDVFFLHMDEGEDFVKLKRKNDFTLKIPLSFAEQTNFKVAAVVHIFYPELADEMKNLLLNIPGAFDVFISTSSHEKKVAIEKVFSDFERGRVVVKIFPNRGRDIAPAFVGFRDVYKNYDVCVHVHSKKSLHATNRLAGWRNHLYENLLGSPEIVSGILQILANDKVGVVFPQYFNPIRVSINWGDNYHMAKNFLHGLGIEIDNRHLIEFPAGSMFWFKPAALAPLLDSGLTFEDFPQELGQLDGTIAHAIERAFLYICEAAGFRWVKVYSEGLNSATRTELDENISKAWHSVLKRY